MMLTYKGGEKVGEGTYWDVANGQRIDVAEESVLNGDRSSTYYRIRPGILLLMGPVIGLLYVLLLPFIGLVTVALLAVRKVLGGVAGLIGRSLSFGWRPKEAYLSGKKKKNGKVKK